MKLIASKRTQRVTNFALAALLVVSTMTASMPFLFSNKAHADTGYNVRVTPVCSNNTVVLNILGDNPNSGQPAVYVKSSANFQFSEPVLAQPGATNIAVPIATGQGSIPAGGATIYVSPTQDGQYTLLNDPSAVAAYSATDCNNYSNVYVANSGSDSNNGTHAATPYATIQKAINSVAAGGTVHIANGTYTQQVSFTKSNVNVVGESKTGTVIVPLNNEYGQGLTSENFGDLTIGNLTIATNNPNVNGASAVKFHNAQNITLHDAIITGGNAYMRGIDVNSVENFTLNNVSVSDFGKNGIAFTSKYATADTFVTGNVEISNVSSVNNGWSGIAFYTVGGTASADIANVQFNGSNTITGNGQVGIFFEGGSDAGLAAHTAPAGSITGANGALVDLGNTVISSNGQNIINYQKKNVYATSATINGAVGNSMTTPQIQAAEATIIDHNDFDSYGDVILDTNAPVVAITNPAADAVIKGEVNVTGSVTDSDPSVSFLYITNAANQIILQQNVNTGLTNPSLDWNTKAFDNGEYTIHLEAKDAAGNEDATVSVKSIHVTVDNEAPKIVVKQTPSSVGANNIYSKLSLSLQDNNNIKSYQINNNAVVYPTKNRYADVNDIAVGSYHGATVGDNTITVYDVAGNFATYAFVLDNVAPTITVKAAPDTIGSNDVYSKLALKLHDNTQVTGYTFNGGAFQPLTPSADSDANNIFVGSYHGEHSGANSITVYDIAGNTKTYSFTLDNEGPTASLVFPARGPSATSFQVVFSEAVNVVDATNPANYFLTNWPGAGGSGPLSGHAAVVYDAASHTATVNFTTPGWYVSGEQLWGVSDVRDLAGNTMSTATALSSDNITPTTPGSIQTATPTNSSTNTWTWDAASDPENVSNGASGVKGYEYQLTQHGAPTVDTAWTFTTATTTSTSVASDGEYDLHVRSADNAGNVSEEGTGIVIIDTTAPAAKIDTPASTKTTNTQPTITGTYTSSDGGQDTKVAVSTDKGSAIPVVDNGDGTWSYTPETALTVGNHTFIATATDKLNNSSSSDPLTLTVESIPETGSAVTSNTTNANTPSVASALVSAITPIITNPASAVLGATTDNGNTTGAADVKGATDDKTASAVNSDANQGKIFGIAWYWWILILAALAAIAWFISGAVRRRAEEQA